MVPRENTPQQSVAQTLTDTGFLKTSKFIGCLHRVEPSQQEHPNHEWVQRLHREQQGHGFSRGPHGEKEDVLWQVLHVGAGGPCWQLPNSAYNKRIRELLGWTGPLSSSSPTVYPAQPSHP